MRINSYTPSSCPTCLVDLVQSLPKGEKEALANMQAYREKYGI